MTQPFVLGFIHDLESKTDLSTFLEKHKGHFEIQSRYHSCDPPLVEIKVKMKIIDSGVEIEFLSEEDKSLFLESKYSYIKLTQI